jgi:2'-5' RNA ligase
LQGEDRHARIVGWFVGQKTHTTAVVLIPPTGLWPPIQAIRQQHDRHMRRWMPHITLVYPFRPLDEFETLSSAFDAACREIEPFSLTLAHVESFHHGHERYTLWLAPEPKEALVRLQTALWSIVQDCDDVRQHREGFTPHLSVGQVRRREALAHLQRTLQDAWQPLSFAVRDISLIWRGQPPDDVFRVARQVRLKL